jgi:hypothetical protein
MSLIFAMYLLRTIAISCDWYLFWLGFVQNGQTSDDIVITLLSDGPAYFRAAIVTTVVVVIEMAIADIILVILLLLYFHAWPLTQFL